MSDDNTLSCRICLEEELEIIKLINPCKCNGTSRYVHRACINEWFKETGNPIAKKMCMECKTDYKFQTYEIEERNKLFFHKNNLLEIYCKNIIMVLPVSLIFFSFDTISNQYYLINVIFPNETKTTFIHFVNDQPLLGWNYYYYIFNYIYLFGFFLHYIQMIFCKINNREPYIIKASPTIFAVMSYLMLFFWINYSINVIMDIESIILINLLCNFFTPRFIYIITKKHNKIIMDINKNISKLLLSYDGEVNTGDDGEISDTDSESFLLNIEIE